MEAALRCGARGALSRRLPQDALLAGIESILEGRDPRQCPPDHSSCHPEIARSGLTEREVDVLCLVADGLTNQEIAERLYLSINTVKTYIRYGYRKIGAERRSHAVIWAERHGLAPPPAVGTDDSPGTMACLGGPSTGPVRVPRGTAPARDQRTGAHSCLFACGLRCPERTEAGEKT